ncbi:ATP F0F1 synthase subunit C [Candidatus Absconditicoccus praedator]|uniref:ATP F0F1 synthase subunit C n=1 Tax=Candidatus Absconditicoccus praedator TaxID=2735562 RepID=UPI001E6424AC|nr:ATP F0F1 synthase subunit C [Candidatus Absconditicoccus praedator]UFX83398.1 ATP F0F1 synthase subunit C [Candidatus Absconditicoccus praedator]
MELSVLGPGIAILGVIGAGIGIGLIGKSWLEALSRNPEASGKYLTAAILSIAFAEATAIFALVVAFLLM